MAKLDIAALRAKALPKLTFGDVFKITDGSLDEQEIAAIDSYLARFTIIRDERGSRCPGCGSLLTAHDAITGLFLGATFTWGIAHGEGHCSGCGYPARAYHFDVGPLKRFEAVLAVHPDELLETV